METKRKFHIPAELILGLVAILAVVGTVWFFLQCVPYILAERPVVAAPTEPSGPNGPISLAAEEEQETIGETIPPELNPYSKRISSTIPIITSCAWPRRATPAWTYPSIRGTSTGSR